MPILHLTVIDRHNAPDISMSPMTFKKSTSNTASKSLCSVWLDLFNFNLKCSERIVCLCVPVKRA